MSTIANVVDPAPQHEHEQERSRSWWFFLAVIAAAQLSAFWLVCSHQVRKAEARRNEVMVQQMALSDCLQYIPSSTIASCASEMGIDPAVAGGAPVAASSATNPAMTGAMPVSFSYH